MGCGASTARFALPEAVPLNRAEGVQRSVCVDAEHGIYRKKGFEGGLVGVPQECPEVTTAWGIVERSGKVHASVKCLGFRKFDGTWKEYEWTTYAEFHRLASGFGAGLTTLFPTLEVGAHVGIYGPSIIPLVVAQYGCLSQALCITPMYDTWSAEILQHVVAHADLEIVVVAQSQLATIKDVLTKKANKVIGCIVLPQQEHEKNFDKQIDVLKETGSCEKVPVHGYDDVLQSGITSASGIRPPQPDADAVIMYTSGSSGLPKGVQMQHSGFVGVAVGLREASKEGMAPGRVVACFLPLGHIYPTSVVLACFLGGCTTGLYHGDPTQLVDDLQLMQPEVLPGVPRVYQTIFAKVIEQFKEQGCFTQMGIDNYLHKQTENCRKGTRDPALDRKLFSKIQDKLGGRLKYLTTGASPMLPALQEWMKVCFNAEMSEGYGLTEAFGIACVQESSWNTLGDVGAPLCCNEIKLADVPDFGYSNKGNPPKGELCVRGVNIMRGYYKDAEKTAEELKEGWLHTGDIAKLNSDGTFSIVDRISNVFKLGRSIPGVEGAVLIAPEVIENQLVMCNLVNQAWVFGNVKYPHLVAVIAPDAKKLLAKAGSSFQFKAKGWQAEVERICSSGDVEPWIMQEVSTIVKQKKIKEWEQPLRIHLASKLDDNGLGFTVENGFLTPTFKLRRGILKKEYEEVLANLYKLDNVEWKK